MGLGYQAQDRGIIDYDLWFPAEFDHPFRGPRADLDAAGAIACIGAAQTFGRFVSDPFPAQLARLTGKPAWNLGASGAGPGFYLEMAGLTDILARAEIVVAQAMSARSVTAGRFETQANQGVLKDVEGSGSAGLAHEMYARLRDDEGAAAHMAQVKAVRARWVELYRELAGALPNRKILLWLSERRPDAPQDYAASPVGTFPHFVTEKMVSEVASEGFEVVEVVRPFRPQLLRSETTGLIEEAFPKDRFPRRPDWSRPVNTYYAPPDLHDAATAALLALIG